MAKRSKLLAALDAHKGKDHEAERQKKLQKLAAKRKRTKAAEAQAEESEKEEEILPVQPIGADLGLEEESEGWESDESELAAAPDTSALFDDESDSDSSLEENGDVPMQDAEAKTFKKSDKDISENGEEEEEDEDGEDEDDEGGIPLSDIESLASSEKADILPHQRLTINNIAALEKAYKSIALPYSTLPFSAHQAITSADPVPIPDVNDDLNRELAFYKQCLDAAVAGRAALKKEGAPFTRPVDYFAEMVKTEEHMGKIKQKIVDEAAGKKAAAEARRQRDLKKFGKQVQVAKLQERSKAKRDALEKIDLLKRKRKNAENLPTATNEEDLFDVALDNETRSDDKPSRRTTSSAPGAGRRGDRDANLHKRRKKDEKFGFGGKKRFAKSNDAVSTGDLSGFSTRKMKGQTGSGTGRGGAGGRGGGPGAGGRGGGGGGGGGGSKKRLGKSRRAKAV